MHRKKFCVESNFVWILIKKLMFGYRYW